MASKAGSGFCRERIKILYIVYWGAAEPLGQSLVLPAVKKLAALGAQLTLVTFEKPADLLRRQEIAGIRASLDSCGVRWIPLRYHKRPKVPATAFDFLQGCLRSIASQLSVRPDIIHGRTFVGGLMGLFVAGVLQSKLIYHNEGFYPDEQVDAGVWKKDSMPHSFARFLERELYSRADGVIALSQNAKATIESLTGGQSKRTPVIVVPSCVDLDHFSWDPARRLDSTDTVRFVYVGSVGSRYGLQRIGRFVSIAAREMKLHLRIITRSDPSIVKPLLASAGLPGDAWSVGTVPYSEMPYELANEQVGLHFLPQGLSDYAGSPTKIGEYWAAGLPAIVTPNAGDTDEIIRRERVGIIVGDHSDDGYRRAAFELKALLEDSELPVRCRRAAKTHYGLEPACERQFALYQSLALPAVDARRCASEPSSGSEL